MAFVLAGLIVVIAVLAALLQGLQGKTGFRQILVGLSLALVVAASHWLPISW